MTTRSGESNHYTIPKWFVAIAVAVMTGAVPWAWQVNAAVTEIATQLRADGLLTSTKIEALGNDVAEDRERLERLESQFAQLLIDRVKGAPPGAAQASR